MSTKFIAYPSSPPDIGTTINGAVEQLRKYAPGTQITSWPELDIAGHFLAHEILSQIDVHDCFVGDISALNFNVTFEIGYAIGSGKRILLTRLESIADNSRQISELGLFDTIGCRGYQNQRDFSLLVETLSTARPIEFDSARIAKQAPLYLLDGKFKTDPLVRVKSRVKKAHIYMRNFDPQETARMSAQEAVSNVAQSAGVIVTLLPADQRDSKAHNLRAAFLAGLATGMAKHLLMIQLGDDPVPLDYRDLVTVCKFPSQIDDAIAEFAPKITELLQEINGQIIRAPVTPLSSMSLGSSIAENEFRELGDYYLEIDAYQRALRGEIKVVLGRKGSGKTALFTKLRD